MAELYNGIFIEHETINDLKRGYLFPLNKPGKDNTVNNTRPLVFLTSMRKVLSNIVLHRIEGKVDEYLHEGQHGFRRKRSSGEVVWATQWINSMAERYGERIHMTSIDLSKAFDCLNRNKLLEILEAYELATEDELRMITFLLSETTLCVKVNNEIGPDFKTSIGTPQGDALSPILFIVYLEHILREHRNNHPQENQEFEIAYADDVNFFYIDKDIHRRTQHNDSEMYAVKDGCKCASCRASGMVQNLQGYMGAYQMQMNGEKTKHIQWVPGNTRSMDTVVLGNNISANLELKQRKSNAAMAFNRMQQIWLQDKYITDDTKVYLYNIFVRPHILYNAGACPYTKQHLQKLDSFHRQQLRRLLRIYYPNHISNKDVYARTQVEPISVSITRMRWAQLGHILRLSETVPANVAMRKYLTRETTEGEETYNRKIRNESKLLMTLPRILEMDISMLREYNKEKYSNLKLSRIEHLYQMRADAQNRDKWKELVNDMGIAKQEMHNTAERWRNNIEQERDSDGNVTYVLRRSERENNKNKNKNRNRNASNSSRASTRGTTTTQQHQHTVGVNNNNNNGSQKRGRGRPRIQNVVHTTTATSIVNTVVAKRRPGRPRKEDKGTQN
jgi:Reverse transcriptase (RNA-dependent DNA polymerase)